MVIKFVLIYLDTKKISILYKTTSTITFNYMYMFIVLA